MLSKKCQSCGEKKEFKCFSKIEGSRKLRDECDECIRLRMAGLNPNPPILQKQPNNNDLELQRRREQYRRSMERLKSGMEI